LSPKPISVAARAKRELRALCSDVLNKVFRYRKSSFTLHSKVVFVFIFGEAEQLIAEQKKFDDNAEYSSRAVEKAVEP
jgi:hypothetical protein